MQLRIAKPSDAKEIAKLHGLTKDTHSIGIFSKMGKTFMNCYYKIILNDPNSVILCVEDDKGKLVGFASGSLDHLSEVKRLKKYFFRLGLAAFPSLLTSPKLIAEIFKRVSSVEEGNSEYITNEKARTAYWVWDKKSNNSKMSLIMNERHLQLFYLLGVNKVYFEIDSYNKSVLKFATMNGAEILDRIQLSDGRERNILCYDLTKPRKYSFK